MAMLTVDTWRGKKELSCSKPSKTWSKVFFFVIQVAFVLKMAMEDEETVEVFKAAFEELDEGKRQINLPEL
jgi:acyl transferase domain-containing protein